MSSKLEKNKNIKLSILATILLSSSLWGSSKHIEQEFPEIDNNINSPLLPIPKGRVQSDMFDVAEELNLFDVSCSGIKYTGALETVAINGLETTKEAIAKMFLPFLSLSTFEVALFAASFVECMVTTTVCEIEGSETCEDATTTGILAANKARNGVSFTAGAAMGSAAVGAKTDMNYFPDVAGTFNAFLKSKVNDGWFDAVMECTQEKRIQNYQKLYEFLNQQFTLKLNYEKMSFSQCNVQLIQEGEQVPSWNAMFGNKISEYTNDFADSLDADDTFSKNISEYSVCKASDSTCQTPSNSDCKVGRDPNCKPFSESEVKLVRKEIGTDIEAFGVDAVTALAEQYPADEGFNHSQNADGTWTVTQDYAQVGAGTMMKKMPALERMQEEWDAEQEQLNAQDEVANSNQVTANTTEVLPFKNPYDECNNGVSSMGNDNCLTVEQAKDYRKNMVRTTSAMRDALSQHSELFPLEKLAFNIMNKNPDGFAETLEYVYDRLKLLNITYTVAVKNTTSGKEDLTYVDSFTLNYRNNFELITTTDSRLIDIQQIVLQNEDESQKILISSPFAHALLKKIVMELTGKKIPVNKKVDNATFENTLKIFYNHRNYYQRFIDLQFMLNKKIKAIDGSDIIIDIFSEDVNELYKGLELFFLNQRLAIKAMFENTTTVLPEQGTLPNTNQGSVVGITNIVKGLNQKDYRQELVKRANEHIIEYKLSGEENKLKSIVFFYKMFLYLNPTSLQDKLETAEAIMNSTTFAHTQYKDANLMHGIVLEGISLEKAKNYKVIEKYIDKRKSKKW